MGVSKHDTRTKTPLILRAHCRHSPTYNVARESCSLTIDRHKSAQTFATPTDGETSTEEVHFTQEQEEQQESAEFQEPYVEEIPSPPLALPPGSSAPPPPALDGHPALHGIAGFLVRTLAPHTEADPAAVLLQFLAAFGNLVGPGPHCRVGPRVTASISSSFSSANRARPAKEPAGARSPASSPKPTLSGLRAV